MAARVGRGLAVKRPARATRLGVAGKPSFPPIGCRIGIALAFSAPILSCVIYAAVAALWFIPDRRLEARMRT
jgi:hypothetical protein